MRLLNKIVRLALGFLVISSAQAELTAQELVQKMDENQLQTNDSSFNLMQLTSCKYGTKDGKLKCVEKPRIKLLESAQINTGVNNKDSKSIAILLEPASERGIGMLTYTYDATSKGAINYLNLAQELIKKNS